MKHLHDYWTDPKLDQGEQFLRDYILNRRFLDKDEEPEVDMNKLLEEERELEEQTEFEHKYNYRFEEPDQEFIKRYPRVMANSLRVKDERRKEKREEIKERKSKEKEKKREKIRLKKKIKKQEIEEKLEQLKKLTGNDQLAFESHLNADFDQDEYDRAMRRLFNEEFYAQEDPNFNPQEAMAEEYDGLWKDEDFTNGEDYTNNDEDINCEDPNFVMDCDYDPTKVPKKKKKDVKGRRARDKHRRTTVSEAVSREKPLFDPAEHCSFQDYIDQYYGIDCEDFIGEQPCRFKYKRVTPNSYGLTVEEILAADDKELERWCSMKRVHKAGSVAKERNDAKMYSKRAMNNELKQKILPSLFSVNAEKDLNENLGSVKTKKNKNKGENEFLNEKVQNEETQINGLQKDRVNSRISNDNITENNHIEEVTNKKRKKRKSDKNNSSDETAGIEEENTNEYISSIDISDNKKQRKRKHDNQEINIQHESPKKLKLKNMKNTEETTSKNVTKKEKKKKNIEQSIGDLNTNGLDLNKSVGKSRRQKRNEKARLLKKKLNTSRKYSKTFKVADRFEKKIPKGNTFKVKKNDIKGGNKIGISDSRLQAYGIKPKVFKDKLKYGSQFKMFLETDK